MAHSAMDRYPCKFAHAGCRFRCTDLAEMHLHETNALLEHAKLLQVMQERLGRKRNMLLGRQVEARNVELQSGVFNGGAGGECSEGDMKELMEHYRKMYDIQMKVLDSFKCAPEEISQKRSEVESEIRKKEAELESLNQSYDELKIRREKLTRRLEGQVGQESSANVCPVQ